MTKKKLSPQPTANAPVSAEVRERRAFTKEFKLNAVARLLEGTTKPIELALELGVRRNMLYKWADALKNQGESGVFSGPGRLPADRESELTRLRRELAQANEELAILKKFDAYLTRRQQ